jgi:hypothetical protein
MTLQQLGWFYSSILTGFASITEYSSKWTSLQGLSKQGLQAFPFSLLELKFIKKTSIHIETSTIDVKSTKLVQRISLLVAFLYHKLQPLLDTKQDMVQCRSSC